MSVFDEYRAKLKTPDEAVQIVKSGDWVDYSSNNGFPKTLDEALARRRDELKNVKIRGNLIYGPIRAAECDPTFEHFVYNTWFCSAYERHLVDKHLGFFIPMDFRNLGAYYENYLTVNVAMLSVTPMNDKGYFSRACCQGVPKSILKKADYVIVEVNDSLPWVCGNEDSYVHISEVDAVVETGGYPIFDMKAPPPTDTEMRIAQNIMPFIKNGSTVQLGIGGLPNALGELIAQSDLCDLGMHTELASDGYLAMHKAGKLTNRCKTLHPGKNVGALFTGSREFYDWVDHNEAFLGLPLSYVNDPHVIAQNDDMISINGCLNVDLFGQVNAESSGMRQISGTGGQLDFVTGAVHAKGGKAFLCLPSTYTDKSGQRVSRIVPHFSADVITTPRSVVHYVVTEHGAANLAGLSAWERADALIALAHPDFRDALIAEAEKQHIWLPSNKR